MPDFPWEEHGRPFVRPRGFFANATNSLLGPPPMGQQVYEFGHIHKQMGLRHHLFSLVMVVAVLGGVYGLYGVAAWLFHSPLTLCIELFGWLPWYLSSPMYGVVIYGWLKLIPKGVTIPRIGGFFDRGAVFEEQWFREGAENWTRWQRFKSAIGFGFLHLGNFIYPFGVLPVLAASAFFYNHVYLRTYRKTGSRRAATLESALMHRCFNRFALYWLFIIIFWDLLKDFNPLL